VLDVGPDRPIDRERRAGPILNFETPHIFGKTKARDMKFCTRIDGSGP